MPDWKNISPIPRPRSWRPNNGPHNENPEEHIVFLGFLVFSKQGSERGEYTIKEIDLNRQYLVDRRKDKIEGIDKMIKAAYRTKNTKRGQRDKNSTV
jgi:hypothetical protein